MTSEGQRFELLTQWLTSVAYGRRYDSALQIRPYFNLEKNHDRPNGYSLLSQQVVTATATNQKDQLEMIRALPQKCAIMHFPLDWNRCFIYQIAVRSVMCEEKLRSSDLCINRRFHLLDQEDEKTQEALIASGNKGKYAVMHVPYTGEDNPRDTEKYFLHETDRGYLSSAFIASMAFINEKNLHHGIRFLNAETSKRLGFAIGKEPPEPNPLRVDAEMERNPDAVRENIIKHFKEDWKEQRRQKFAVKTFDDVPECKGWYCIPADHVLSWCLKDIPFARSMGYEPEKYQVQLADTREWLILFYFVPDYDFYALRHYFVQSWMGKTEMRSLSDVSIKFVEEGGRVEKDYKAWAKVVLSCLVPPVGLETFEEVAPVLSPLLPPPKLSLEKQIEIKMNSLAL